MRASCFRVDCGRARRFDLLEVIASMFRDFQLPLKPFAAEELRSVRIRTDQDLFGRCCEAPNKFPRSLCITHLLAQSNHRIGAPRIA